jgi:hypothetical protein
MIALGRAFAVTGQAASVLAGRRLTVPDRIPYSYDGFAATFSVGNPAPSWTSTPAPTFIYGTASSYDLTQHVSNFNSANHQMTLYTGTLPAQVTLDPDGSYVYAGGGSVTSVSGISIQIVDSGAADWTARSAGSAFANRLDTQTAIDAYAFADYYLPRLPVLSTTVKPSGASGSMRFQRLTGDTSSACLAKIPFGVTYGEGQTFWVSYRIYADAASLFQPWPTEDVTGRKIGIISATLQSNLNHELVVQDTNQSSRVYGYYQDGNVTAVHVGTSLSTSANSGDFAEPYTDRSITSHSGAFVSYPLTGTNPDSGSSWSTDTYSQERAKYGYLYSAYSTPGTSDTRPGLGDPISGVFRYWPAEWITITQRVVCGTANSFNSRWTVWAARENGPYALMWDKQNIRLGSALSAYGYNCFWPGPYVSSGIAGGRSVLSRTNNIGGITIHSCGCDASGGAIVGTPVGAGTLEYNATTQRFRWAGNGESFGTARGFSVANNKTRLNVVSGTSTNSWLVVEVTNSASLPSSGVVTDTVTIADGRPECNFYMADMIVSTSAINAPGGYAPVG